MPAPNILWICTDSQRFDTLGCYGNPHVRTPNADRLAREGVLFRNCFAQNPLCTPSRGSFLTGRYPITTKLRQNGQSIPPGEKLVTRLLADHDYLCGLSGKLHIAACNRRYLLGPDWWQLPRDQDVIQGTEPRIDDGYAEFYWDHAPSELFRSSAYQQWLKAKGAHTDTPPREGSPNVLRGMPAELHQTTFCVEMAENFIERYAGYSHPWLFSVNIFDPHFACDPPEEYLRPYLDRLDSIPLPNYVPGELDNKPPWQMARHAPKSKQHGSGLGGYGESDTGDPRQHRLLRAAYWAQCDLIDAQIGRLFDALERTGQRENTMIVFTSDHGEMLGDHGFYIKGPFLYDPAIQVPLIVSWPGHVQAGVETDALVELSDLAPTLLDAAGLPRYPGMQTRSLWPLLTGAAPLDRFRDDVYCEYLNSNPDNPKIYLTMVRTATHKIVAAHGAGTGELYDLAADPTETRNLWDDPAAASVKTEMLVRLCDRLAMTADPLPPRTGIY